MDVVNPEIVTTVDALRWMVMLLVAAVVALAGFIVKLWTRGNQIQADCNTAITAERKAFGDALTREKDRCDRRVKDWAGKVDRLEAELADAMERMVALAKHLCTDDCPRGNPTAPAEMFKGPLDRRRSSRSE